MDLLLVSDTLQPVLDTSLDAAIVMGADGVVMGWNRAAEAIFGWTRQEAIGRSLAELIVPPDLRAAHYAGLKRYRESDRGTILGRRIETTALHKDGRLIQVELAITPTRDRGQEVFLGFLRDISARKRAETALRESEQRLKATYENAFVSIAEADAEGRFLRMNTQLLRITGYTEAELRERTFLDITHPDDVEPDRTLYRRQWAGELDTYTVEKRYVRRDGNLIWIEVRASLVRDEAGAPLYGVRVVRDISERKRAEAYQQMLIGELNHRVKNVLAIVQGIAQQTFKNGPAEQAHAFAGRLSALAAAHDVVVERGWESASLEEVIVTALQPYRLETRKRFDIGGPDVALPPKTVVTLSLALYELATNAAKYGALSADRGRVSVAWTIEPSRNGPRLRLLWVERGGPPVRPPEQRGFGMRLIERGLAAELNGDVRLTFEPEGLVCAIDVPMPKDAACAPE